MFTGIVEEAGKICHLESGESGIRMHVETLLCGGDLKLGDSLAVNGCCLTVVEIREEGEGHRVGFDLLQETWNRTSFQQSSLGDPVNLERALSASARLGGHFVSGHVDAVGIIRKWERVGSDHVLEIEAPPEVLKYVVHKGSITVDGISLTVAGLLEGGFRLWIIPHTYEVTSLRIRRVGDQVNLEADLIGKYVERLLQPHQPHS